jgi:hypothetical protein
VGEDVTTRMRLSTKLRNDGNEEVAAVLLIFVPKIAIKMGHSRESRLVLNHDIFYYPRTAIICVGIGHKNKK